METLLIVLHYFICFFLIIVILLQAGKGADIGAVFGGASQTIFGGRGPATFLNKLTAVVAIAFLISSIWLAQISKTRSATSVLDKVPIAPTNEEAAPSETPTPESHGLEKSAPETPKQ